MKMIPDAESLKFNTFFRSNQDTCLSQRPLVKQGQWVAKGQLLADSANSVKGDLALGKNVLVAYMPWEGYNFEDSIVISDRLIADDIYTSIHILRFRVEIPNPPSEMRSKSNNQSDLIEVVKRQQKKFDYPNQTNRDPLAFTFSYLSRNKKMKSHIYYPYQQIYKFNGVVHCYAPSLHFPSAVTAAQQEGTTEQGQSTLLRNSLRSCFRTTSKKLSAMVDLKVHQKNLLRVAEQFTSLIVSNSLIFAFPLVSPLAMPKTWRLLNREYNSPLNKKFTPKLFRQYSILREHTSDYGRLAQRDCGAKALVPLFLLAPKVHKNEQRLCAFAQRRCTEGALTEGQRAALPLFRCFGGDFVPSALAPLRLISCLDASTCPKGKSTTEDQSASYKKVKGKNRRQGQGAVKTPFSLDQTADTPKIPSTSNMGQPLQSSVHRMSTFNNKHTTKVHREVLKKSLALVKLKKLQFVAQNSKNLMNKKGGDRRIQPPKKNENQYANGVVVTRTPYIPFLGQHLLSHLDEGGIAKVGTWVTSGDILVGKAQLYTEEVKLTKSKRASTQLAWEIVYNHKNEFISDKDKSFRLPKGIKGRIIRTEILSSSSTEQIHIYLAVKRKIQVGDKLAGRHGNKGIVSLILPKQDMPYLPDGTPIDIILSPLGVPSRMNVGQLYECLLGLAAKSLGCDFKVNNSMTTMGKLEMRAQKLTRKKRKSVIDLPLKQKQLTFHSNLQARNLVFLKLYESRLSCNEKWLFSISNPGKVKLFDGRTGQPFSSWVTVGYAYMLKLVHLVDNKIHSRSTGPYSLITRQPVAGKARQGGQRIGEMEAWALEGFGAAYTLQEFFSFKGDDVSSRHQRKITTLSKLVGNTSAFKKLLSELRALCINLEFTGYTIGL